MVPKQIPQTILHYTILSYIPSPYPGEQGGRRARLRSAHRGGLLLAAHAGRSSPGPPGRALRRADARAPDRPEAARLGVRRRRRGRRRAAHLRAHHRAHGRVVGRAPPPLRAPARRPQPCLGARGCGPFWQQHSRTAPAATTAAVAELHVRACAAADIVLCPAPEIGKKFPFLWQSRPRTCPPASGRARARACERPTLTLACARRRQRRGGPVRGAGRRLRRLVPGRRPHLLPRQRPAAARGGRVRRRARRARARGAPAHDAGAARRGPACASLERSDGGSDVVASEWSGEALGPRSRARRRSGS